MDAIWLGSSVLSLFCILILGISLFTPKTALFFRVKTKRKAILLWSSLALAFLLLSDLFAPSPEELKRRLDEAAVRYGVNATETTGNTDPKDPFAPDPAMDPGKPAAVPGQERHDGLPAGASAQNATSIKERAKK